jgi:hypothetical protein
VILTFWQHSVERSAEKHFVEDDPEESSREDEPGKLESTELFAYELLSAEYSLCRLSDIPTDRRSEKVISNTLLSSVSDEVIVAHTAMSSKQSDSTKYGKSD